MPSDKIDDPFNTGPGLLLEQTWDVAGEADRAAAPRVPCLSILLHPDLRRIGERVMLNALAVGDSVALSRGQPAFSAVAGGASKPLGDPFVSRQPVMIESESSGGVRIVASRTRTRVVANGAVVTDEQSLSAADLNVGIVLELAGRVVILLHARTVPSLNAGPDLGLVGASESIEDLRSEILRVVDVPVPVLLRGETGTGKELAATAIHGAGDRAKKPLVTVNMASVPATLAASELFGHVRGAFTGAVRDHKGHFEQADGGTLFLDEVGDTPADVQVMLLRVLETREITPVGARRTAHVDVRLIAATDADLEVAIREGGFRAPLFHRLSGYTIRIPPLRERRDDIGRLFLAFLTQELDSIGERERLSSHATDATPWIPSGLMRELVAHSWPGNVRELRNVVRQIVIRNRGQKQLVLGDELLVVPVSFAPVGTSATAAAASSESSSSSSSSPGSAVLGRTPGEINDEELIAALRVERWRVGPTATRLGIPKSSLYYLIQKCAEVRTAKDVTAEEILAAQAACGGDLDRMTDQLEVSRRGIQLRMRELGLV